MVVYVTFLRDVACQKLLNSANVSWSYSQNNTDTVFLRHGVYGIYIVLHIDYVFLTERHVREQSMLDTWQLYYCLADSL